MIGLQASGKTTFLAQLYTRIQERAGKVKLSKEANEINIEPIKDAVRRLSEGDETQATSSRTDTELILPIEWKGKEYLITSPEYGGEQVRNIYELMQVHSDMAKRVMNSDQWLLFIRPGDIFPSYDLSKGTYKKPDIPKAKNSQKINPSKQSNFIEIVQALLWVKGQGIKAPISKPRLFVVLTCWDELGSDRLPLEILKEKLPLFKDYLEANWQKGHLKVLGLSAQEFPLNADENKDKYLDEMPSSFGYLVEEDGGHNKDLTLLIQKALSE